MSGNDLDAVSTQADKKHTKMWWITDLKLFGLTTAMTSKKSIILLWKRNAPRPNNTFNHLWSLKDLRSPKSFNQHFVT